MVVVVPSGEGMVLGVVMGGMMGLMVVAKRVACISTDGHCCCRCWWPLGVIRSAGGEVARVWYWVILGDNG